MKKPLYASSFEEIQIKPIVSEEKDKYLSIASLKQLEKFFPDIDSKKNSDLLPVSFSACVVNRVNKNRDVITTSIALDIYKTFINKPINIEHDRKKVIGCILTAGFSEFGTEKPLTEEEVKDMKGPFNITLGGLVWRTINEEVANLIEDCSDPSSENYQKISASWELGFEGYSILAIKGSSKNAEDGRLITDPKEVEDLKSNLTCLGGTGLNEEDNLYRCPTEGVLAVGIGFTESPAAEVKGIAVDKEEKEAKAGEIEEEIKNNEISISQPQIEDVKDDRINMKITSLKDITDESLKTAKASEISELISQEISKINDLYVSEKSAKENFEKESKENLSKATKQLEEVSSELEKVKKELVAVQEVVAKKEKEENFSKRMAEFDEEYELDDEDRQTISAQISDLTEEGYAAFKKNAKVFFKNRKKGDKSKEGKMEKEEVKASASQTAEEIAQNAKEKSEKVPATPAKEETLKDKWAKAFSLENVSIVKR